MTLRLHRATRSDVLADGLAAVLRTPLADPFATEVVVVPAKGVERWLSQRLSHHLGADDARGDGVCAGVDFRTPTSLVAEITGTRDEDPWSPDALVWPLLAAIDSSLDETWAATLARHLGHGLPPAEADLRVGRRYAVARRLAGLFASYAVQRPALVADWAAGRDTDGAGKPLDGDLLWQAELWRRLAAAVPAEAPHLRHAATLARLRDDPGAVDLPARVSLFGHTRLPVTEIELLAALGEHREVHLWLPHPSDALWAALVGDAREGALERRGDPSHQRVGHRLLATLGRDTRELQRALAAVAPVDESLPLPEPGPDSLLQWLQADIRANATGPAAARTLRPDDRSVQVHACHGAARQVEVLREVLLGLLADDPTLEPRDVLVMCPDVETYAPLISAGFGLGGPGGMVGPDGHPAHRLRVQLADRALTQTNPVLGVAATLLDLAGGRAGASHVVDLAHAEPVRRRFGFSDDDLVQLTDWVRAAGIHWAFDAEHREEFGLSGVVANTWQFGLDRILAGVTLSDDADTWLDRTLPLDDVGSGQVDLAGRVAEYVDRLRSVTDHLVGSRPLDEWLDVLGNGVGALTLVSATDAWQSGQVQRELERVRTAADAAGGLGGVPLRLPDLRALLGQRLGGRPTRANFRTGTMTVCTMVPMRSVPHRVVCLVGLDDGVFPRVGAVDGDDVLARRPLTGERDPRSEDRQLLLDAVLAATETLVVTYTGANEYSGQPRPPAVPLGEVLDALDETATAPDGSVSHTITVHHPLQSFDRRNVVPGELVAGHAFTFDRSALAGANAAAGPRRPPPAFLDGPLPARPVADVGLDELLTFFRHPVRGFVRGRLDLALPQEEDDLDDALPVELDALEQWSVGDRVLRDLLAGLPVDTVKQREWRRGVLPPGRLGWRLLDTLVRNAEPLAAAGLDARNTPARSVDVDIDLGGGRRLRGTVPGVYGERLVPVGYSRLAASHRLQSWVSVLALSVSDPDRSWTALTIGRAGSRSRDSVATSLLGPLDHRAVSWLADLVALRDRGLSEPLPLPLKTSLRYAAQRRTRADTVDALRQAGWDWKSDRFPGEDADPAHVRAFGARSPIPGLDTTPGPGEDFAGETSRFGALALRLWSPLLDSEQGSW